MLFWAASSAFYICICTNYVLTHWELPSSSTGLDAILAQSIEHVRSAIEERIERVVLGGEIASPNQQKAFRLVRTGNFPELRLLHLLNRDDGGSVSDPLKAMKVASFAEDFVAVTDRISRVLTAALLPHAAEASTFFAEMRDELIAAVKAGVAMSVASEFYRATIAKACAPVRSFQLGQHSRALVWDTELITGASKARSAFERELYKAHASQSRQHRNNKHERPDKYKKSDPDKRPKPSPDKTKPKDSELSAFNVAAGARHSSISDGDAVAMPKGRQEWSSGDGKAFRDAHPPRKTAKRNIPQCWNFWHPQGCKNPANCDFSHGE